MKKTKKTLASLAIAGMALTMVPFNVFATGTVPTRLFGTTAAETAVQIADQTGWTGTAILASSASYGMVDALTSGPLAKFLNAPILLQEPGAVLNAYTKAELTKLNVTKVYVTSGTAVINQAVLDELKGMNITVESLGGNDRFETSVNIAKKMVLLGAPVTKVAVAYGWLNQDALSIASIASANNEPILLTEKNALPASVKAFLTANITSSDVIGGTAVISDAVKATLPNATRHYGNTAYDTNEQVIKDFESSLSFSNVFVANAVTGIDALAGAPLAAVSKSAIVLTDGVNVPAAATFVNSKLTSSSVVTALGGIAVVPESVRTGIVSIVPATLAVTSVSAINGKTVEIKFNKAVDPTTVITAGKLSNITFTNIGSAPVVASVFAGAVLSDDGMTLTITPQNLECFGGDYAVTVTPSVLDKDGKAITAYSAIKTLSDSARPTIASATYSVNGLAHFAFSEPLSTTSGAIEGSMVITAPTGAVTVVPAGRVNLATDNKSFDLNMVGVTPFTADKVYTVLLVGLADYSGNLISPNPITLSVVNSIVDNVKPAVQSVEAIDVRKLKITFSEKLSNYGTVNTIPINTAPLGNATVDTTGTVVTYTEALATLTGIQTVTLAGYVDLSLNPGDNFSKVLNFVADTTNPTYVSSQVATIGTDQYLLVKYSENVTVDAVTPTNALTGTYVDANSITKPMVPAILKADASTYLVAPATTTDTIKIKITGLIAGAYTVAVDPALVKDIAGNAAATQSITFVAGTTVDTTIPTATITSVQATEDTVVVDYSMPVTAATALNLANYTVEGQNVFASAIFDGTNQKVVLKLMPNAITVSGNRLFGIQNVATAAGKVMVAKNVSTPFVENMKPYVISAALTNANTITVTFSENVTGGANAFDFYVDSVKSTGIVTTAPVAGVNTATITIPDVTDLTKTYQVKFVGTGFVDGAIPTNAAVVGTMVTVTK